MIKIRHVALLAFILLINASTASAQHRKKNSGGQFDFEIRGGLNLSQIDGDAAAHFNKIGFHGSVGTSMAVNDDGRWRLAVEIGLSQKGSHISNTTLDRRISLLYVEVPVMVAYDFLEGRQLRVAAGVAPAILASSKVTTDGVYDTQHSNNYKPLDALPLCAKVRYRFTDHLAVDFQYYNSMLNIARESANGTYRIFRGNKGQFNRLFQVGLALAF